MKKIVDTITVTCPADNKPEREYSVCSLLNLLDVDYRIVFDATVSDYIISYDGNSITIKDTFFSKYSSDLSYLSDRAIPARVSQLESGDSTSVVVIFGGPDIKYSDDSVVCGVDVFAGVFFMLTRWEEFVLKKLTPQGKVIESELLLVKEGFFDRPVVNEYAQFLSNIFKRYGYSVPIKKHKFEVMLTHDVDWMYLSSIKDLIRNISVMIKSRQYNRIRRVLSSYLMWSAKRANPFDTFDEIIDYSDKYNFKSHFYFRACSKNDIGVAYQITDSITIDTIRKIKLKGHYIGFHPSESTLDNEVLFSTELKRLKDVAGDSVIGGRSHNLLYNINSWNMWNNAGLEYDSGCGFQQRNGFRAGITQSYEVFDLKNRKRLPLRQIPFIVMDSVALRNKLSGEQFYEDSRHVIDAVRHYGGVVCMNWHSNLFNSTDMKPFCRVYSRILDYLGGINESK